MLGSTVAVLAAAYLLLEPSPRSATPGRQGWNAPFAGIPYPFPHPDQPSVTWFDTIGFAAFLVSAAICLGQSLRLTELRIRDPRSATGTVAVQVLTGLFWHRLLGILSHPHCAFGACRRRLEPAGLRRNRGSDLRHLCPARSLRLLLSV